MRSGLFIIFYSLAHRMTRMMTVVTNTFNSAPNPSLYVARGYLSTVSTVDSAVCEVDGKVSSYLQSGLSVNNYFPRPGPAGPAPLMLIIFIGGVRHHHL